MSKKLVVYYSWSNGNTKRIAEKMAKELGADKWNTTNRIL